MSGHLIVGAGGTASWLVPLLKKMVKAKHVVGTEIWPELTIVDGDRLEMRNLDRQLFNPSYIGWNKAEALADLHGLNYFPCYLQDSPEGFQCGGEPWDTVWCCADNHIARFHVLEMVDKDQAHLAIIGGNEYYDSEAYGYRKSWKDTPGDPRVYYPEIITDQSNDPTRGPNCQGQAQEENRQLALANYLSAGMMVHLWLFITTLSEKVDLHNWPIRHFSNFSMFTTKAYG
jgi:hypothetical protein